MPTRKFSHTPTQIAEELRIDSDGKLWWINPKVNRKLHKPITGISNGYITLCLDRKRYQGHVVAWALYYGEWPSNLCDIDHIDGVRDNNRKENLRLITHSQNTGNTHRLSPTNTSGATGVYFNIITGKWRAYIMKNYRQIYGGEYDTQQEAISARLELKRIHC